MWNVGGLNVIAGIEPKCVCALRRVIIVKIMPFQKRLNWTQAVFCFSLIFVANLSKKTGQNNSAKTPPFEEALKKLENVIEAMESDDLPLETLLAKYEEGSKLVKMCQEKLVEAELKIQQLEKSATGEMKLKPFESDVES
jgi:exodeoxyribonuclease VII small subunit